VNLGTIIGKLSPPTSSTESNQMCKHSFALGSFHLVVSPQHLTARCTHERYLPYHSLTAYRICVHSAGDTESSRGPSNTVERSNPRVVTSALHPSCDASFPCMAAWKDTHRSSRCLSTTPPRQLAEHAFGRGKCAGSILGLAQVILSPPPQVPLPHYHWNLSHPQQN
jgi:hypothetical protein